MLENPGLPMTIADEILRKTSVEVPEESDIFLRLGETMSVPKYMFVSLFAMCHWTLK